MKIFIIILAFALSPAWGKSEHKFQFIKLKENFQQKFAEDNLVLQAVKSVGGDSMGDENSPIFESLQEYLQGKYEGIGENKVQTLLNYNRSFDLGSENHSGFTWEKPFGHFRVGVNRQLAPDLFDDVRWIVTDTFVISVDATTYLNRLNEEDALDMTEDQIRAFAGISFQRVYKYEHFADSFWKGLTSDFSKLFMSFLKFRKKAVLNMQPYEYITKEDFLSVAAGAAASYNYYCISFSAGVLATFDRIASVTIQSLGPNDNPKEDEFLRLSVEKTKSTAIGVTLGMQLDLLELLKLHLFTYDFQYTLSKTQSAHLSFYEKDKEMLMSDTPQSKEFHKMLRLQIFEVDHLTNNVVSLEERTNRKSKSKLKIFHYGNVRQKDNELINFVNNGEITTFMKHQYNIEVYHQNILSTLLGGVVGAVLNMNMTPKIQDKFVKNLSMEYESHQAQGGRSPSSTIEDSSQLSIALTQEFAAKKTTRQNKKLKDRKAKRRAIAFMERYTSLDKNIVDAVKSDELRGPMMIQSTMEITHGGIDHLNSLSEDRAFYIFANNVCNSKRPNRWSNNKYRKKYLRRPQIGSAEVCTKQIGKRYLSYKGTINNQRKINIDEFRKFMEYLRRKADSRGDFDLLFGERNIFMHGQFQSKRHDGGQFQTNFRDGEFNGIGVIDNFMRENGL